MSRPAERARVAAILAEARAVLGVRYRPQGRSPDHGLDCIGVAALAARAGGFRGAIPADYPVRGGDAATLLARFDASGLRRTDAAAPGDLALFATGPGQCHLVVLTPGGIIHADAALRRVVARPGPPPWPLLGCWRVGGE